VPAGTGVLGIEVRLDARVDGANGAPKMCVSSPDGGGITWRDALHADADRRAWRATSWAARPTRWGRTWSAAELSDASFRVRVDDVANSTSARLHARLGSPCA
jgi:hypothetical protein